MKDNAYLNLQNVIEQVHKKSEMKSLDELTRRLLQWICNHYDLEQPLYIQTLMMRSGVASPATIYKSLILLRDRGLISIDTDPEDSRRRIVSINSRTRTLLSSLDRLMRSWIERQK